MIPSGIPAEVKPRNTGRGEAEEHRDTGTGAEGGDGSKAGAEKVAQPSVLACQIVPHPFDIQGSPQHRYDVDHHQQQGKDLAHILHEEMQRIPQLGLWAQAQLLIDQPAGEVGENLKHNGSINICVIQKTLHVSKGCSYFPFFLPVPRSLGFHPAIRAINH